MEEYFKEVFLLILSKTPYILIFSILILVSITIDLIVGLIKSDSANYLITSDGLKRSVSKLTLYIFGLALVSFIDMIGIIIGWFEYPYISALLSSFLIVIEIKSVFERADKKERKRILENAEELSSLLANREELAKAIHDYLKKKREERENE